ncbi:hypothetical protein KL86PLE_40353 [uncultured Pleomorphomonas sp.]|uniref:Uncharacterized protein n=1 Tax=uncultured Pleomorphomonas sp. TaxID=442121 RepID=A0A212LGC7_9HYPH|nr:hypothetical protein KL86PLE_40353 [uncultured Pleomorphomonas sp.]
MPRYAADALADHCGDDCDHAGRWHVHRYAGRHPALGADLRAARLGNRHEFAAARHRHGAHPCHRPLYAPGRHDAVHIQFDRQRFYRQDDKGALALLHSCTPDHAAVRLRTDSDAVATGHAPSNFS